MTKKLFILAILLFSLVILTSCLTEPKNIALETFSNSACQQVKNSADPTSTYTKVLKSSSYSCEYNECIVSGTMKVDKLITQNWVVFRTTTNSYTGGSIDVEIDGSWTKWNQRTNQGGIGCSGTALGFKSPEGFEVRIYRGSTSDRVTVCVPGNNRMYDPAGGATTPRTVMDLSKETTVDRTGYLATYNFCPSTDPDFAYCKGTKNTVTQKGDYATEERLIMKGDSVQFLPKNGDNSDITERYIRVRGGDCACISAVSTGTACTSSQLKCLGNICPTGKTLVSGQVRCGTFQTNTIKTNQCVSGDTGTYVGGIKVYGSCQDFSPNLYSKCDGNQTVDSSQCGAFSSTQYTCPSPQICLVSATGQVGTGVGNCKCPADQCYISPEPQRQKISETSYQECETKSGGCLGWSSTRSCPTGLVFNDAIKACVLNPINSCEVGEAECQGTQGTKDIKYCEFVSVSGLTGFQWQSTPTQCSGEEVCNNQGTNIADDRCSCELIDECSIGQIKCVDSRSYLECGKTSTQNSCLKYRSPAKTVASSEECFNNQIRQRDDIGCAFNTPGYDCSTLKDAHNIFLESCDQANNFCKATTDQYSATSAQLLNTRCSGNVVQKVTKYADTNKTFYRWETKTDAVNSVVGTCTGDFVCVAMSSTQASCEPKFENINIFSKSEYGVGETIEGISLEVIANIQDKRVSVELLEAGVPVGNRVSTQVNAEGKTVTPLSFGYASPRTGTLTIHVRAGDPAGVGEHFDEYKNISIKKSLNLDLNCPFQAYKDRETVCSWTVKDSETGLVVPSFIPTIKITQGGVEITNYDTKGSNSLVAFKATIISDVVISISASSVGYLSDTEQVTLPVTETTIAPTFNFDGQDFFSVSKNIEVGSHQLAFEVLESGVPLKISNINAFVNTPSGATESVAFIKETEGKWKGTYNFKQAGQTYTMFGQILPQELAKLPIDFRYQIVTIDSLTEDDKSTITYTIVGVAVFVIVFVIVMIVLLRRKKR